MILIDLLFAFLIALVVASVLSALFGGRGVRRAGAWPIFFFLFLILLPTTWAGGIWIAPYGPIAWGSYWLPFVTVGILVALLLAALAPPGQPTRSVSEVPESSPQNEDAVTLAVGGFFWLLLLVFAIAIIVRYV